MTEQTICECGMIVKGTSKKHVVANLVKHKVSKRHKEQLALIKTKNKGEGK